MLNSESFYKALLISASGPADLDVPLSSSGLRSSSSMSNLLDQSGLSSTPAPPPPPLQSLPSRKQSESRPITAPGETPSENQVQKHFCQNHHLSDWRFDQNHHLSDWRFDQNHPFIWLKIWSESSVYLTEALIRIIILSDWRFDQEWNIWNIRSRTGLSFVLLLLFSKMDHLIKHLLKHCQS